MAELEDEKNKAIEMLRLQLSEMDMLESMFPNEFQVDDPSIVADMNEYVEGKIWRLPGRLDFGIHIEADQETKFHMATSFPHNYPSAEPEVFVRSQYLDRTQQHKLNEALASYIQSLERGELCMFSIIQWLQDNAIKYVKVVTDACAPQNDREKVDDTDKMFMRYWIYSHHIYNKEKRRNILDFAKELNISGFCLPGKPGIICAEGNGSNCAEFWHKVKQMTWKKIMCKMKEVVEIKTQNIDKLRRFQNFEEIAFEVRKGPGREYHMDMGEFFNYLENHRSGYVFKNYFGVDGKVNNV